MFPTFMLAVNYPRCATIEQKCVQSGCYSCVRLPGPIISCILLAAPLGRELNICAHPSHGAPTPAALARLGADPLQIGHINHQMWSKLAIPVGSSTVPIQIIQWNPSWTIILDFVLFWIHGESSTYWVISQGADFAFEVEVPVDPTGAGLICLHKHVLITALWHCQANLAMLLFV